MGDAQLSSEPTRNLIVSSTPIGGYKVQEHIAPDQQSSATTSTTTHPTADHYSPPQASENSDMAAPMVQQPYIAQQPRYSQQSYIPAPYMQQRAASVGHGVPQGIFNMANMQRSLPMYQQQQQQQQSQQGTQAPQVPPNSQQRFQAGHSPTAVAYQLSQQQQMQQFQGGVGTATSSSGQYYHVPGFQQPFFDPYAQHYIHSSGQQDTQAQQQQQQGAYYTTGYPQYPQSAGPAQTHFAPQWFGPPQINGYYYIPPPQVPNQHISQQIASPQHQQQVLTAPYIRRHSIPARQSPLKRRGSETDASVASVAFVGYPGVPQWDSRGINEYTFRGYGQLSRGPSG